MPNGNEFFTNSYSIHAYLVQYQRVAMDYEIALRNGYTPPPPPPPPPPQTSSDEINVAQIREISWLFVAFHLQQMHLNSILLLSQATGNLLNVLDKNKYLKQRVETLGR